MNIRCPNCKTYTGIHLPQHFQAVTVTVTCPECRHVFSVDISIKDARPAGPSEVK